MKKIVRFLVILSFILPSQTVKADILESFIFEPAFTIEFQVPEIMASGQNDKFENKLPEQQLGDVENIVLGLNLRLHRYFGLNGNWTKFTMKNETLEGYSLDNKANLEITSYNMSSLFYLPLIGDSLLEGFLEVGVSDINSNLKFSANGTATSNKSHETAFLYGGGIQFAPYDSSFAFRISVLKQNSDIPIVNGSIINYRVGMIKYF